MVTSRDVAQRAGVSRATVSAVVNGSRFVSPDLRERVEKAILELDYQPNALARSLRTSKTYALGVIIPTLFSPFFAGLVSGVAQIVSQTGYSLILCSSEESAVREAEALRLLAQKRVDGLLLISCCTITGPVVMDLVQKGIPVVLMDRRVPGLFVDTVVSDNFAAGYQATEHLIQAGCRRIGLMTYSTVASSSRERLEGYRAALAAHDLTSNEALIAVIEDVSGEGAYAAAAHMLELAEPPDGLFLCSQRVTASALTALRDRNVCIPLDIKVIGFDDTPWAPLLQPGLTVIEQQVVAMGRNAAELLLHRLNQSESRPARQVVLETRLICRASCGCLNEPQE